MMNMLNGRLRLFSDEEYENMTVFEYDLLSELTDRDLSEIVIVAK